MDPAGKPKHTLEQIQRWMQAVVMHPSGVPDGLASREAHEHINVPAAEVERLVTRSQALTAVERLAIYNNAYFARLLECLHGEFPALAHALGEEIFDGFAFEYLQQFPSRSYTLGQLGANFGRFLEQTRPEPEGEDAVSSRWPDFLIDLVKLESAFNEVFDGPGVEGKPVLEARHLLAVPAAEWPEAQLVPVPCLRLLALRFPVHTYYRAFRQQQEAALPEPADTFLAITRRDYVVFHYPLSRPAYEVLGALAAGEPVGQAIARAAELAGPNFLALAADVRQWFHQWAAEGFFQAVRLPGAVGPAPPTMPLAPELREEGQG